MNVSVEEVIEAANRNGYIHCRGDWFNKKEVYDEDNEMWEYVITEACIMGQVAINLGVTTDSLGMALNDLGTVSNPWLIKRAKQGDPWSDTPQTTFGIADAAISYNDGSKLSYNEIAKKLVDWLTPYIGKTLNMDQHEYKARRKDEI